MDEAKKKEQRQPARSTATCWADPSSESKTGFLSVPGSSFVSWSFQSKKPTPFDGETRRFAGSTKNTATLAGPCRRCVQRPPGTDDSSKRLAALLSPSVPGSPWGVGPDLLHRVARPGSGTKPYVLVKGPDSNRAEEDVPSSRQSKIT